jgi:replicative DNA helicase
MENATPYDYQLEEEVIGSMLYDPACITDLVEILKPNHFYYSKHQLLCEEIYRLWQEDEKKANVMELVPFLEKRNIPVAEVHKAISRVVTTAGVTHHAQRIKDLASLRNLVNLGREMATWGHLRDRDEIREAINKAENEDCGDNRQSNANEHA